MSSTSDTDPDTIEVRAGRAYADQWRCPDDPHGLPSWSGEFTYPSATGPKKWLDWEVYVSKEDENDVPHLDGLRVEPVINREELSPESAEALAFVLTAAATWIRGSHP